MGEFFVFFYHTGCFLCGILFFGHLPTGKEEKMKNAKLIKRLVESALLIALSTVLSTLKLIDMPYGGSVTFASMLPVMLIAYRYGIGYGAVSAGVYAVIQQLLGLENFAYLPVPTPVAIIGLIIFDYALAFLAIAIGGIFRGRLADGRHTARSQSLELMLGAVLVCVLRYICHTVAGATVWQELPIPDGAAIIYSISYNATYMIPETLICAMIAFYLGGAIDFLDSTPKPFIRKENGISLEYPMACRVLPLCAWLFVVGGVIADTCLIFKHLQDGESGEFTLAYLSEISWTAVAVVTAACAAVALALFITGAVLKKKHSPKE